MITQRDGGFPVRVGSCGWKSGEPLFAIGDARNCPGFLRTGAPLHEWAGVGPAKEEAGAWPALSWARSGRELPVPRLSRAGRSPLPGKRRQAQGGACLVDLHDREAAGQPANWGRRCRLGRLRRLRRQHLCGVRKPRRRARCIASPAALAQAASHRACASSAAAALISRCSRSA